MNSVLNKGSIFVFEFKCDSEVQQFVRLDNPEANPGVNNISINEESLDSSLIVNSMDDINLSFENEKFDEEYQSDVRRIMTMMQLKDSDQIENHPTGGYKSRVFNSGKFKRRKFGGVQN